MGRGWNLVAVPGHGTVKNRHHVLLVRPIIDTLTFSSLGAPAPNRGTSRNIYISGLKYEQRVADAETHQPLHVENGMWLLLDEEDPRVARQASVPHGDVLLAIGPFSTLKGPPSIPDNDSLPITGKGETAGYAEDYLESEGGFNRVIPNQFLQEHIREQKIIKTITLDVSTANLGGISNIPFVVKNADVTLVKSTFWIETVVDKNTGQPFQQLQYSQQVNLEFFPRFDDPTKRIIWPHITVATLVKQ